MKVLKVKSQGFCRGVMAAIIKIRKALDDPNLKQPVYMLGSLVHNQYIVNAFKNKGIRVIVGKKRLDMLDEIEEGTVIFTAHGVHNSVYEKALNKGLDILDATCKDVTYVHQLVEEKLSQGYKVLFLGKRGHPETEGIIGSNPNLILLEKEEDIQELPAITSKVVLTNQTTMSYLDVIRMYERLKQTTPHLELVEEVCGATRTRQSALMEAAKEADLVIVVGDPESNNTKILKEVAEKYSKTKAIMIETVEGLNGHDFSLYETIAVTSGASTPSAIVDEIIETLSHYNSKKKYLSKLTDDDYLKG